MAAAAVVGLSGCASLEKSRCPAGQQPMRTAQLFFGQNIGGKPGISDAEFRKFTDEELTSRFPQGLTVLDGGGQWKGPDNKLIREAAKVVVLVLPARGGDVTRKLGEVRQAYVQRFRQDSVMLVTQKACVAF
ncbi:MAG TPA: DUF3574 domain-containing protein [Phenylobacterium sp.]|nr:DUF3574 domain-containing protein [Phenylobacterium sp.]